jgi:hypothetical protein
MQGKVSNIWHGSVPLAEALRVFGHIEIRELKCWPLRYEESCQGKICGFIFNNRRQKLVVSESEIMDHSCTLSNASRN